MRDVKELVAAQVVVTGRLARIHGRDVNGDIDCGFGDVFVVQHNRAVDLAESSPYGGNGHMPDGKLRGRMLRIDPPLGRGGAGRQRQNGCESGDCCDS